MKTFNEFVDHKTREARKHLGIIKKVLEAHGKHVADHRDEEEPYIFLRGEGGSSFDGVRIYNIAGSMAYRIQREEATHPYGRSYPLDIEEMFSDYLSDEKDEKKAGKKVMKAITEEFDNFFQKSAEAEEELKQGEFDHPVDPMGRVAVKTTGTDYANQVQGWTHSTTSGGG
jgi:hypothetical protein